MIAEDPFSSVELFKPWKIKSETSGAGSKFVEWKNNNYKAATNNIISYIVLYSSPYHLSVSNLYLKLESGGQLFKFGLLTFC